MSNKEMCNRPGCSGIIEDDFCTDCCQRPLSATEVMALPAEESTQPDPVVESAVVESAVVQPVYEEPIAAKPIILVPQKPATPSILPPTLQAFIQQATTPAKTASATTTPAGTELVATTNPATQPEASLIATPVVPRVATSTAALTLGTLGLGIVDIPPLPRRELLKLLMTKPEVSLKERRCRNCQNMTPLGTEPDTGRVHKYCKECSREYDFTPTLKPGKEALVDRYEVTGVRAYGGMGWIYGAWDIHLARELIIKGCRDAADADAKAQAKREREFMAKVKHPNIVSLYEIVRQEGWMYMVMEYVAGHTLDELMYESRTVADLLKEGWTLKDLAVDGKQPALTDTVDIRVPLPIEKALAYVIGILPALSHLHKQGLVFCDFNPRNFMVEEGMVKLIDLGSVKAIGDLSGDMFFTDGYAPKEVAEGNDFTATFDKDLYAVGRTLLNLVTVVDDRYLYTLPDETAEPLFAKYPALYRTLAKATHKDPAKRFHSAEEMRNQLIGVLHQIAATKDNSCPTESSYFGKERLDDYTATNVVDLMKLSSAHLLPKLKILQDTPDAQDLVNVNRAIEEKDFRMAHSILDRLEVKSPTNWRTAWYRGASFLKQGKATEAREYFRNVVSELPGELAPQLAYAMALEATNDFAQAAKFYQVVSYTDPAFVSAAFGLGRSLQKAKLEGAADAFDRVPPGSSHYMAAQRAVVRAHLQNANATVEENLSKASKATTVLTAISEGLELHLLSVDVLTQALEYTESNPDVAKDFANVGITANKVKKAQKKLDEAKKKSKGVVSKWVAAANESMKFEQTARHHQTELDRAARTVERALETRDKVIERERLQFKRARGTKRGGSAISPQAKIDKQRINQLMAAQQQKELEAQLPLDAQNVEAVDVTPIPTPEAIEPIQPTTPVQPIEPAKKASFALPFFKSKDKSANNSPQIEMTPAYEPAGQFNHIADSVAEEEDTSYQAVQYTGAVEDANIRLANARSQYDHLMHNATAVTNKARDAAQRASNAKYKADEADRVIKQLTEELEDAIKANQAAVARANALQVLGCPLKSDKLRLELENQLLWCARFAKTSKDREAYIKLASSMRPFGII